MKFDEVILKLAGDPPKMNRPAEMAVLIQYLNKVLVRWKASAMPKPDLATEVGDEKPRSAGAHRLRGDVDTVVGGHCQLARGAI